MEILFLHFAYILKNDNTVYSCGDNEMGQLGLENNESIQVFTRVNIS
jgi:alpha-tubulin suppressor-like RCC1 family protein